MSRTDAQNGLDMVFNGHFTRITSSQNIHETERIRAQLTVQIFVWTGARLHTVPNYFSLLLNSTQLMPFGNLFLRRGEHFTPMTHL
jgi:hypothetical protein